MLLYDTNNTKQLIQHMKVIMKKECKYNMLSLFLVLMIVPIHGMFVSRVARRPLHIIQSHRIYNESNVGSIQHLKLYFEQQTKDDLTALFNTLQERDEFMDNMKLHDKIIKKYYDPKTNRPVKKDDPLLTPLFCTGVKSVLSTVNMHPEAVTVISADHLTRRWSPTSYMVRRELKRSLKEMYPSVAPKELVAEWVKSFKSGVASLVVGGVIVKESSNGKPLFIPPYLIFSSDIHKMHNSHAKSLPQEIQYVIGGSVGQLLMKVPNTIYQLEAQLTNRYRFEKYYNFLEQSLLQASLACDIEDYELAKNNYFYLREHYLLTKLYYQHKKVYECHAMDRINAVRGPWYGQKSDCSNLEKE